MPRPKGSKNKAKDDAPKAGHNINGGLTDEQRQALHFQHTKSYEDALALKKKADKDFKDVCKVIKAEGGSTAAIRLTVALRTPEGEAAFRARMAEEVEVAAWNGVGVQVDMFADERKPAADKAFEAGRRAGLKGEPAKPPHDPSTEQYRRWMEGFGEGQSVLAKGFKRLNAGDTAEAA